MRQKVGVQHLARQSERQLERHGDGDSLFFEDRWYTRGWMADQAARFGAGLTGLGVRPGDRVVVLMANCPEVLVTYTAAWRAGAVVTPLIFLVSEDELRHALADSGAVAVVTTPEFLPKVQAAARGVDSVRFIIVAGRPAEGGAAPGGARVLSFAEVAAAAPGAIVDRADDDLAALLYTGGTTGRSKGVPLTHANLFWCGSSSHQAPGADGLTSTLMPLPLAHAYGLLVTCVGMHAETPQRSILMRWFDPAGWLKLAQQHRAQRTTLVPSMIQMLLTQPLDEADLSALVAVSSGAAPLSAETREEFERRVPSAMVYEGYGCTESASIISSNPLGARRLGSVGLPVPGCTVQIRDDAGQVLPPGQDGEICVHSPGVLSGYWQAPDATATAVRDGWLYTGDIGHLDDDGYLYVVDRKKDLIIRGGFNVYPRDVEEVGFVALRKGASVTGDELVAHAREQLAATKYPREIRIVPAIPLTSVGKLDRKRLRTLIKAEADGAAS
jgi:long-chain acyl-CoA synthetase